MFPFPYLWQFWRRATGGASDSIRIVADVRFGASAFTARVSFEP